MGRRQELELRVLRLIDRVLSREALEDSEIEFKAKFEAGRGIARDLAGHANAAGGEEIVWLFGLHEKSGQFFPLTVDFAQWHDAILSEFCDVMPRILDSFEVAHSAGIVRVVLFDTSRAPFVVRAERMSADSAGVTWEVPWKEGTKSRSATREDLLRILVPRARTPKLQVLAAKVQVAPNSDRQQATGSVLVASYIYPVGPERIVMPFHECIVTIEGPRLGRQRLGTPSVSPPSHTVRDDNGANRRVSSASTIALSKTEAVVDGPGMLLVEGRFQCEWDAARAETAITVDAALSVIGAAEPASLSCTLSGTRCTSEVAIWSLGDQVYLHRGY